MRKIPLLSINHAEKLIADSFGMTPLEAEVVTSMEHPQMELSEFPVNEIPEEELRSLREQVRNIAEEFGFPFKSPNSELTGFDRSLSVTFPQLLQVPPAHARSGKMWTFLTCVVLLDIAIWRFPNTDKNSKFNRYIGNDLNKNTFSRLWWRGYQVGELSTKLDEDNAVALMERTRLSGDSRVARAVINALEEVTADIINRGERPALGKMKAYRSLSLELRALGSLISYASLTDATLDSMMLRHAERLLAPR